MTNLRELYVDDNQISDLYFLRNLLMLEMLSISRNNITDISGFEYLKSLSEIRFYDNDISDISPMKNLPELRGIDLRNNNIYNLKPLVDSPYFGYNGVASIIYISNNPLDSLSVNEYIPILEARGVEVYY